MTKFGKFLVFLILLIVVSSFYYFFKKQNEVITLVNNATTTTNTTADDIRNQPFPLAGMDNGSTTTGYVMETFIDKVNGVNFQYPKQLLTKYMHPVEWPPKVGVINGSLICTESGSLITEAGITEKRIIASTTYCVNYRIEGAAGSTYTDYTYKTLKDNKVIVMTFSMQAVQCVNYDDPNKTECENERKTFNIDNIINNIISTIK